MTTSPSLFNIVNEQKGDILILRLKGRLDAVSSPEAEHIIFHFIENGQTKLIFDLQNTNYISSAGLRTLLSIKKKLNNLSGKLVLCNVQHDVNEIFRVSGFIHILESCENEEEALNIFNYKNSKLQK